MNPTPPMAKEPVVEGDVSRQVPYVMELEQVTVDESLDQVE